MILKTISVYRVDSDEGEYICGMVMLSFDSPIRSDSNEESVFTLGSSSEQRQHISMREQAILEGLQIP